MCDKLYKHEYAMFDSLAMHAAIPIYKNWI